MYMYMYSTDSDGRSKLHVYSIVGSSICRGLIVNIMCMIIRILCLSFKTHDIGIMWCNVFGI